MQLLSRQQPEMWTTASLQRVSDIALLVFAVAATVSISLMQASYIIALIAFLIWHHQHRDWRHLHLPLIIPIGGFALASLLATLTAVDPLESLVELRNVMEMAVFFLIVNALRSEQQTTTLLKTLLIMGSAVALYGLSQAVANGTAFRIYGTTNYMTFAGQLMLLSTMALAQLLFSPTRWRSQWLIPIFLILLAALLNTHTRNAWLGFAVACIVLAVLRQPRLIFVLPILGVIAFFVSPQPVQTRIRSMWDPQDPTVQERLSMWRSGLHMAQDNPWTGVGMGSMEEMYERYREAQSPIAPERRISHLHNNAVQIVAERGLIGLSWWLVIWGVFLVQTWHVYRKLSPRLSQAKALVAGSLASIVGFLAAGGFEHNFGDSEVVTIIYVLMALPFLVRKFESAPATIASSYPG